MVKGDNHQNVPNPFCCWCLLFKCCIAERSHITKPNQKEENRPFVLCLRFWWPADGFCQSHAWRNSRFSQVPGSMFQDKLLLTGNHITNGQPNIKTCEFRGMQNKYFMILFWFSHIWKVVARCWCGCKYSCYLGKILILCLFLFLALCFLKIVCFRWSVLFRVVALFCQQQLIWISQPGCFVSIVR